MAEAPENQNISQAPVSSPEPATKAPPDRLPGLYTKDENGKETAISLYALAREDMTAESYVRYEKLSRDTYPDVNTPPLIYLATQSDDSEPEAKPFMWEGRPIVLISVREHQWTAAFALKTMYSNDDLNKMLNNGSIVEVNSLSEKTRAEYERIAKTAEKDVKGLTDVPTLYATTQVQGGAFAKMTQEGKMFIFISPVTLAQLSSEQLLNLLSHELDHLKHGDPKPESLARAHNDPAWSIANEKRADKDGTGPQGTCTPDILAQALEAIVGLDMKQTGRSGEEYYKGAAAVDIFHQPMPTRLAGLKEAAAHPPEECKGRGKIR